MRKKCISTAAALLAMLTAGAVSVSASETPHYMGDVNGNGTVEITDVTAIQLHADDERLLDEVPLVLGDVNEDEMVDVIDATWLQLAIADLYCLPHSDQIWREAEYEYIYHPVGTEQVWVVDQEAASYNELIYAWKTCSVCNGCGADVGDDVMTEEQRSIHMSIHQYHGEPTGFYKDYLQVLVDTKHIDIPEKGHYEERVVTEPYTEKKTICEAGWWYD